MKNYDLLKIYLKKDCIKSIYNKWDKIICFLKTKDLQFNKNCIMRTWHPLT